MTQTSLLIDDPLLGFFVEKCNGASIVDLYYYYYDNYY